MIKTVQPEFDNYGGTRRYYSCEDEVNKLLKQGWKIVSVSDSHNSWTHGLKSYVLTDDPKNDLAVQLPFEPKEEQ